MRRLLPTPADEVDLDEAYDAPVKWVRAVMVESVDGAAEVAGSSALLSSPVDRKVLALLRGHADVVLVGAATVRAEGWRPPQPSPTRKAWRVERGMTPVPAYAVLSGSGDVELGSAEGPVLVLRDGPLAALDELYARGMARVLCEGGPSVLAQVAAHGRLDELCLTISPRLAGPGRRGLLDGPSWPTPRPLRLTQLLAEDDWLFARYAASLPLPPA